MKTRRSVLLLLFMISGVGMYLRGPSLALPPRNAPGHGLPPGVHLHLATPTPSGPDPACETVATHLPTPTLVTFPGPSALTLHGFLFKPAGSGPFPAVLWNHGSEEAPGEQAELAKFYVDHGFVFFIPHRHGQGRSADAGDYIVDLEQWMKAPRMSATDQSLVSVRLHDWYNQDVIAAITWLKHQPFVKPHSIAVSGCSYGGIQTILTAEQGPEGVRAYIPFAPAAESWGNPELGARLLAAIAHARAPIFLIQAQNDYSTGPYDVLGLAIANKGGLNRRKLYEPFGNSAQAGHACFATKGHGIEIWGHDVLAFLHDTLS